MADDRSLPKVDLLFQVVGGTGTLDVVIDDIKARQGKPDRAALHKLVDDIKQKRHELLRGERTLDQIRAALQSRFAAPHDELASKLGGAEFRERRREAVVELLAEDKLKEQDKIAKRLAVELHIEKAEIKTWADEGNVALGLSPLPPRSLCPALAKFLRDGDYAKLTDPRVKDKQTLIDKLADRLDHGLRFLVAYGYNSGQNIETLLREMTGIPWGDVDQMYKSAPPPERLREIFAQVRRGERILNEFVGKKLVDGLSFEGVPGYTFDENALKRLYQKYDQAPARDRTFRRKPLVYPEVPAGGEVIFGELVLTFTTKFEFRWNDEDSGADNDGAFFHPVPPPGFKALSTVGTNGYHKFDGNHAEGWALCVRPSRYADAAYGPISMPHDYNQIWSDVGSGADFDGSTWETVPQPGYHNVGDIFVPGHISPPMFDTVCVREDLTEKVGLELIWNDVDSGADSDVSVCRIVMTRGLKDNIDKDPDLGLIGVNGIRSIQGHKTEGHEDQWCLKLPFPRREHYLRKAADGRMRLRTVWIPMCAVKDQRYKEPARKFKKTPFYRVELYVHFDHPTGRTLKPLSDGPWDRRWIVLPGSITRAQYDLELKSVLTLKDPGPVLVTAEVHDNQGNKVASKIGETNYYEFLVGYGGFKRG